MCLASTCLTIDEVGTIIAVENVHSQRHCSGLEDVSLSAIWTEHLSEGEVSRHLLRLHVQSNALRKVRIKSDAAILVLVVYHRHVFVRVVLDRGLVFNNFVLEFWPHPHIHMDPFIRLLQAVKGRVSKLLPCV